MQISNLLIINAILIFPGCCYDERPDFFVMNGSK
jgi:hypothetical protein